VTASSRHSPNTERAQITSATKLLLLNRVTSLVLLPVYPSRHIAIADSLAFDAPLIAPPPRLSASYMIQIQKPGSVELHDSSSGPKQTPNPASNTDAGTRADSYLSKDCFAGCASRDSNAENVDPSSLDFLSSFSTCSRNSFCSSSFFSSPVTCQKLHVRFWSSRMI